MKDITLVNGVSMPPIALGLWKNILPPMVKRSVKAAIDAGYRHFDTAQIYGNERFVGSALKESRVPRSELFVTTKIWNGNQPDGKFQKSFEGSLKKLQTEYVDLLLLHYPVTETRKAAWRLMEEAYTNKQARAIGVSNYTIKHLTELFDYATVKPHVNQVELHVFLQQPELLAFCSRHDIVVEAYSPIAHGNGLDNEVLQHLANKYHKTPAQIMIRWCIESGTVPLPKSSNPRRIQENIEVFDFELDSDDMEKLAELDAQLRTCWDPSDTI